VNFVLNTIYATDASKDTALFLKFLGFILPTTSTNFYILTKPKAKIGSKPDTTTALLSATYANRHVTTGSTIALYVPTMSARNVLRRIIQHHKMSIKK
jgi:hypothetical protein